MIDQTAAILDAAAARRAERRRFLKFAGSTAAIGGGLALSSCFGGGGNNNDGNSGPSPTPTPTPTSTATPELDVLNFALQLEYLEAQFYSFAATGAGLPDDLLTGTGVRGAVTGGHQVAFSDPVVASYAREIAADERAHVAFLRTAIGATARVAMPAIDLSAAGAFTTFARAAGVVGASGTFDPYASDEFFLLGAYVFEDVGVTAYKGAAPILIANDAYLEAAAGLLAAEAYHAGLIRTTLYEKGLSTTSLRTAAQQISDQRDLVDGRRVVNNVDQLDSDQGLTGSDANVANIAPTDGNGLVFSRSTGQVLNIAYLNNASVTSGGFFPAGLNGAIKTSAASAPAATPSATASPA